MNLLKILLTTKEIIFISVGSVLGVILVIVLFLILDKFCLARKRCEKQIYDLEQKYEFNHSVLVGQDSQYISRLEFISRTNLLYADIHSTYFRRYKEIRDIYDLNYQESVNALKDLLNENEIKEFKKLYAKFLPTFQNYYDCIDSLNRDLLNLLKPEEEARQKVLILKEKFRDVKSKFNSKENELSYVADSFNKVFEAVDAKFTTYDNLIESAKYDEGKELLPQLDKVLDSLTDMIFKLPDILVEINDILPEEIAEINEKYKKLVKDGFPLKSFGIEEKISKLEYDLNKIREQVLSLRISKVDEEVSIINEGIEIIKNNFEEEKESREIFETSNERISATFKYLENEFIKLSNNLPKIRKYYVIDEAHTQEIENIKKTIDTVSKDKRRLEIYTHQMGQTPYQILVEKMNDLDKGTQEIRSKITSFLTYKNSLKTDVESAFKLIHAQYSKIKRYETCVRNELNEEKNEYFEPKFEEAYDFVDEINEILSSTPIDVSKLNHVTNKLTLLTSSIFNEVDSLYYYKTQTINQILIGNRERQKFSDVNTLLDQAEKFFDSGDYKKASELSSQALNTLRAKDGINN